MKCCPGQVLLHLPREHLLGVLHQHKSLWRYIFYKKWEKKEGQSFGHPSVILYALKNELQHSLVAAFS